MPAGLPGETIASNQGNPQLGNFVIFDCLSGPKNSPLDHRIIASWDAATKMPTYSQPGGEASVSTGALSTGIGIGGEQILDVGEAPIDHGFNDNDIPGAEPTYAAAPPNGVVTSSAADSTRMYIGGGRSDLTPHADDDADDYSRATSAPNPYTAGIAICGAGNGGSRDTGANTGYGLKMVTATGAVANGAAVEAGFINRSGAAMISGQSVFGSASAALATAS